MLGSRKALHMVARNTDIYTEVENWIGKADKALVRIESSAKAASQPYTPMPGYVCIGSVTAHPQSGPWFVLMALEENAQGIIDRYNAQFGYAPTVSGTPPNTSLILTPDELAFIDEHFGGSKSAAIHAGLAALKRMRLEPKPSPAV
jgi:hypothetical protein